MKKIALIIVLLAGLLPSLLAQSTVLMGSQSSINSCGFIIYDDGGQSGDYAANVDQTLTIYSNDPSNGCVMVEIQNLDIDSTDTLIFYDGVGTGGTELHRINNTNYDPTATFRYAATIQNSTGALTVRFISDSAGGGAGFTLFASCMAPCQRVEIHLDTIQSSHKPHIDPDDGYYYVDVCPYDTVHFVAYCDYPDNNFSYPQSHALTTFLWDFDLSEVDSLGLTAIDHYFTPGRGYDVATLRAFNAFATGPVVPDLTILLDLPAEAGLERVLKRTPDGARDRIESETLDFHRPEVFGVLRFA